MFNLHLMYDKATFPSMLCFLLTQINMCVIVWSLIQNYFVKKWK